MAAAEAESSVFHLEMENEMRIIVAEQATDVTLELLSGFAEIFGSEMVVNKVYSFPPSSSIAVFTWHGCTLRLLGNVEKWDIINDTLMMIPVSLHACLEEMRINAESECGKGPVALVVGPTDVGKSTLCRLLLNYAARLGRKPLFIDLDVGQNSISIPGSIGILPIEKPADVVDGFGQQAVSVHHFGYKSPGHNIVLYILLIKKLGEILKAQMSRNPSKSFSGILIDTCGWVRGHGYSAITVAAMAFEIDVLFVLEEQRLYLQLKRDMPACVQVVFVPKLGGVLERSRPLRTKIRDNRVQEYFYGSRTVIVPHSFAVKFSEIQIFKLISIPVSDSAVVSDVSRDDIRIEPVGFGHHLINQVLGISFANSAEEEDIVFTNILGYICITAVDMDQEFVTVLSPQPSPLPKRILLMGDIRLIT